MLFHDFIARWTFAQNKQMPSLSIIITNNLRITYTKLLTFLKKIQPDEFDLDTILFTKQDAINLDDIRPLQLFLSRTSIANKNQFAVVSNAACMNLHVSNSLLKIVEDLSSNQHLFFIANARLVPTLHSRALTLFDRDETYDSIDYRLEHLMQDWAFQSHEGLLKLIGITRYVMAKVMRKRFDNSYPLPESLLFYFNKNAKYNQMYLFDKWQQINAIAHDYLALNLDRRHVQHMLLLQLT
ncbi:DNA polymerase III subunit delta' [Rickettsiales endosymbiont of Paramecium tredecaurelia]|uniref:hypothetical protein n=1 Tax=Candidatus Sarmatiella mevalonica TaxID=2770581 RepID=UPI001921364C|nr:hypothetical protein [Candidatus Sarmatiella mevalonica]MBL3285193.1 DNA polymerase III subunit delta' [Candidatus Sarmatiella mevalonica]